MPIYEYECRKCGVFDYEHSMSASPLARCPSCRSKVTKLISATAFHLKGGGWYADGYDRKSAAADTDSKAETKAEAKAEAKSEAPSATTEPASKDAPASPPSDISDAAGTKKRKKSSKSGTSGKSAAA